MTLPSTDGKQLQADVDWVNALASALAGEARSEGLRALTELLIARNILDANPALTYEQREGAMADEINERVRWCRSDAFAHDLLSMAGNNDPDLDEALFPDGRAEIILIADSEMEVHAEGLLERYIDYIATYPHYDLIHPSDYSGPREDDEEKEWARLVDDFSWMLRQWRDSFMSKLLEDSARKVKVENGRRKSLTSQ